KVSSGLLGIVPTIVRNTSAGQAAQAVDPGQCAGVRPGRCCRNRSRPEVRMPPIRRKASPAIRVSLLLAVAGLAAGPAALAATPEDDAGWKVSGDVRGGWFASERTARDGTETDQDAFNARLRVALEHGLGERWTVRTRVAGRFSSDQDGSDIYLRAYAPTRTGAAFGDVTL